MHFSPKAGLALASLAALGLTTARPAAAQVKTFDLTYSGADFGNNGVATGTITLDESHINNPGYTEQDLDPFVTAFSLTVTGAASGNGTFGLSDYGGSGATAGGFVLETNGGTLDFNQELVGQSTPGDPYGTPSGSGGDFNIFENAAGVADGAPEGIFFFQITTNAGNGDSLHLTSFAPPAVPEASTTVSFGLLLALGMGGVVISAKRKKAAASAS